jgi:hypothetical protein
VCKVGLVITQRVTCAPQPGTAPSVSPLKIKTQGNEGPHRINLGGDVNTEREPFFISQVRKI